MCGKRDKVSINGYVLCADMPVERWLKRCVGVEIIVRCLWGFYSSLLTNRCETIIMLSHPLWWCKSGSSFCLPPPENFDVVFATGNFCCGYCCEFLPWFLALRDLLRFCHCESPLWFLPLCIFDVTFVKVCFFAFLQVVLTVWTFWLLTFCCGFAAANVVVVLSLWISVVLCTTSYFCWGLTTTNVVVVLQLWISLLGFRPLGIVVLRKVFYGYVNPLVKLCCYVLKCCQQTHTALGRHDTPTYNYCTF